MFKASIISLVVLPLTATCALAQANTMTSGRPSLLWILSSARRSGIMLFRPVTYWLNQPPRRSSSTSRRLTKMGAGTSRRLSSKMPAPRGS